MVEQREMMPGPRTQSESEEMIYKVNWCFSQDRGRLSAVLSKVNFDTWYKDILFKMTDTLKFSHFP